MKPSISLILPTYNESGVISDTINRALEELSGFLDEGEYELVIAENGSTDDSEAIVRRIAESDERIWYRSCPDGGRGHALSEIIPEVNGDIIAYMDVDLATDLEHLEELIESVRTDGYDVVTGSRYLDRSVTARHPSRFVASKGFNFLARVILGSDIKDHQCGFKAFRRDAILELLPSIHDDHWFWDTELLVRAQREGYSVKEFGVGWEEKGDSEVDLVRDVLGMGSQLVRTFWELQIEPRITRRRSITSGFVLVALAILLMFYWVDYEEIVAAISTADYSLVAIAAVVYVFSLVLRGLRYRDILRQLRYDGDMWFLTGAVSISQTANFVVPARAGDAVRAYIVKTRRQIPYTTGFASLAIERLFDLVVIAILAGAGLLVLGTGQFESILTSSPGASNAPGPAAELGLQVAAGVAFVAILFAAVLVITARMNVTISGRLLNRLSSDSYVQYVQSILRRFVADLQLVGRDWGTIGQLSSSTAAIWMLDIVTGLLVLGAFDVDVLNPELFVIGTVAICIGTLSKVLPLTPGGIGLYEGVFTVIVTALTPISLSVALSAAILDHAVKNLVTIVAGAISVAWFNVSLVSAIEESEEIDIDRDTMVVDE